MMSEKKSNTMMIDYHSYDTFPSPSPSSPQPRTRSPWSSSSPSGTPSKLELLGEGWCNDSSGELCMDDHHDEDMTQIWKVDDKDNTLQDDEHNTTQERGTPQYKVRVHLPKLPKGKFDKNVR